MKQASNQPKSSTGASFSGQQLTHGGKRPGIVECEVIQWFVEPGARVEEFSPLCEVQSDKASVEITSRFPGVVKKLYYENGDMAKVGKPFIDIDVQGDAEMEAKADEALASAQPEAAPAAAAAPTEAAAAAPKTQESASSSPAAAQESVSAETPRVKGKHASLATPAVRHLSKELKVDITDIWGTGKDGRVLKEDIYKFVQQRDSGASSSTPQSAASPLAPSLAPGAPAAAQTETPVQLSQTQQMMFKSMTRSLNIPHFLFADEIDFTNLVELRRRLNRVLSEGPAIEGQPGKLSFLPFVVKAVSMALNQFPVLNSRVDVDSGSGKPQLIHRAQHNIGIAMDTPQGLLVPVVKDVGSRNILGIAAELTRLQGLAMAGKLSPADMTGGTITVSNIGNIGGTYLSPVIVEKEVSILGMGRMRTVPAFDEQDNVVKKQVCNFSWSADHRVVDGATMARAAEVVRRVVEEPDVMVMHLR